MKNLETYLKENFDHGIIDHRLRAHLDKETNTITFYIHADGKDSDTLDFWVIANSLAPKRV